MPHRKHSDPPRKQDFTWLPLATVVYAWSDTREAEVDRNCWKMAGRERPGSTPPQARLVEIRGTAMALPLTGHWAQGLSAAQPAMPL